MTTLKIGRNNSLPLNMSIRLKMENRIEKRYKVTTVLLGESPKSRSRLYRCRLSAA
jgi:hypothetical protein